MSSRLPVSLAVAALVALLAIGSGAGEPDWECHGPYGGLVYDIQIDGADPDRLLVYTVRGHYLSEDGGASWRPVHPPKSRDFVLPMALDHGRIICHSGDEVLSSSDGKTWLFEGRLEGRAGLLRPGGWCCTVNGPKPDWTVTVSRRMEEGWAVLGRVPGAPQFTPWKGYEYSRLLLTDRTEPDRIRMFLFGYESKGSTQVLASDDGGKSFETWVLGFRILDAVHSPWCPGAILAAVPEDEGRPHGLLRSTDGGRTWIPCLESEEVASLRALAVCPKTRRLWMAGTRGGVHRLDSREGKLSPELTDGLFECEISALAVHPDKPDSLWAGTQAGLFRTEDGGGHWRLTGRGIAALQFTGLEAIGERLLAFSFHQGPRTSTDGGRTWLPAEGNWRERNGRTYQVLRSGKAVLVDTNEGSLLSPDGGRHWIRSGLPVVVSYLAAGPRTEFFAVREDHGLLRSTDGLRWAELPWPFPDEKGYGPGVCVADTGEFLLAGETCIARLHHETGEILGRIDFPEARKETPRILMADPGGRRRVYTQGDGGEICAFDFETETWSVAYTHAGSWLVAAVADPGKKDRRIAAYRDGHLAISEDGGDTFRPFAPSPGFRIVTQLAVTEGRSLAATADGSVYTFDLAALD